MPRDSLGRQMITFELVRVSSTPHTIEVGSKYRSVRAICVNRLRIRDTESQRAIADANKIRSILFKMKPGRKLIIPAPYAPLDVRSKVVDSFNVTAGDSAPTLTEGYAKYDTEDRPMRTGLTVFTGFDPLGLDVPINFDAFGSGRGMDIERDIALLERMAGRGVFKGAGVGFPGYVNISSTDNQGKIVPLIPRSLQAHPQNPNPPKWVVADIDWDENPLRNREGNRIRQQAVVHLMQYVAVGGLKAPSATNQVKFARRAFQPSWYRG